MRTYYPSDFADYQRRFGKYAGNFPDDAVGPAIEWRRGFLARMRPDLLRAPHADLSRYMTAQLAEIRAFANVSADACVRYATSDYGSDEPYPSSVMPAVREAIRAKFQAANEGRRHPARSPETRASRSDVFVLVALLERRGISRDEIAAMTGSASMTRLPIQRRCEYFVELPSAVFALPPDLADRIWVTLLAEPGALGGMIQEAAGR